MKLSIVSVLLAGTAMVVLPAQAQAQGRARPAKVEPQQAPVERIAAPPPVSTSAAPAGKQDPGAPTLNDGLSGGNSSSSGASPRAVEGSGGNGEIAGKLGSSSESEAPAPSGARSERAAAMGAGPTATGAPPALDKAGQLEQLTDTRGQIDAVAGDGGNALDALTGGKSADEIAGMNRGPGRSGTDAGGREGQQSSAPMGAAPGLSGAAAFRPPPEPTSGVVAATLGLTPGQTRAENLSEFNDRYGTKGETIRESVGALRDGQLEGKDKEPKTTEDPMRMDVPMKAAGDVVAEAAVREERQTTLPGDGAGPTTASEVAAFKDAGLVEQRLVNGDLVNPVDNGGAVAPAGPPGGNPEGPSIGGPGGSGDGTDGATGPCKTCVPEPQ